MTVRAPKGTKDVLPWESHRWQYVEKTIRELCALYAYREMRTPVFEHTELFLRGVGDTTDIVQKEMYTFTDKGMRSVTLKPEGTAGIVRGFVEHKLYAQAQPVKVYYLSAPVFRYENPQAGRLREHHQFGVELFGSAQASADAEVIAMAMHLFERLGVKDLQLKINSIGCKTCRPAYDESLKAYFQAKSGELCKTCNERLCKNPLRILDCKEPGCAAAIRGAPPITGSLCAACARHFTSMKQHLEALGIPYTVDPFIVRGLDYYTRTVFEVVASGIGAQGTVCGGGRYDGLVEEIGGPPAQGVGFGLGLERLLLVLESQGIAPAEPPVCDVFVCTTGGETQIAGFTLAAALRRAGVRAECDHMGRSLKAQFKYADKTGARAVLIIGGDELARGTVKCRDMARGEEKEVQASRVVETLAEWGVETDG